MRLSQVPVLLVAAAVVLAVWSNVAAAEGSGDREAKTTAAMSQDVFEGLQKAQTLIESKQYPNGHQILQKLLGKSKLSSYETAQIWNLTAYAYYLQERYRDAIKAYENVLSQPDVSEAIVQSTLKTVSQLYFTLEDHRMALTTVRRLMTIVPDPSPDVYMLLGQAHFQLDEFRQAVVPIQTALEKYRSQGQEPKENWLLLLRACYYELKDYKKMVGVLKEIIARYPKESYLLTLAGVYSELGDTRKQLALSEALFEGNYLAKSHHLVNLANLYLLHGVPYKAAKALQTGIDRHKLKADERTLRLLSQAWHQARDDNQAIPPLARAAELSGDGELYVRLAQSYINLDQWEEATEAVQNGLDKGGVKRTDVANIMLGMALFNQRQLSAARRAFAHAAGDKRSAKAARQWITYVESELQRKNSLEQTLPQAQPHEAQEILHNL